MSTILGRAGQTVASGLRRAKGPGRRPELLLLVLILGAAPVVALLGRWNGDLGSRPQPRTLEDWAQQLRDPDPDLSFEARLALMERGRPAVPVLCQALRSPDVEVRVEAVGGLAGLAQRVSIREAVPDLIRVLDDPDPRVRAEAANALRLAGPRAREAVPRLQQLAGGDPNHIVRDSAARAARQLTARGD